MTTHSQATGAEADVTSRTVPMVAIGASAGGLEALERFFRGVPDSSGLTFVVIQHLSSDHKSVMDELLARHTRMPVNVVAEGDEPAPDTVWLIPPGQDLVLEGGRFLVHRREPGLHLPIDTFFASMAKVHEGPCAAVVLSGTGSDGSRGLGPVKESGGVVVVVQDPRGAKFDGMPESALATGLADLVLAPEAMAERIIGMFEGEGAPDGDPPDLAVEEPENMPDGSSEDHRRIFSALRGRRGIDFSAYKRSMVSRRIARRMLVTRAPDVDHYADLVQSSSSEQDALFQELLIGVTRFFRDGELFDRVREEIIRPMVAARPEEGIRIWVPGCSTGEEAYTIAMLLLEEMDAQKVRVEAKIFASDIDQRALEVAGRGIYPGNAIAELTQERASRFFEASGDGLRVTPRLRGMVLFARHDVTSDPPFTRLDLVSCRNLLIYLSPEQQQHVLTAFHVALRARGGLLLGRSEAPAGGESRWHRPFSDLGYYRPDGSDMRMQLMKDARAAPRARRRRGRGPRHGHAAARAACGAHAGGCVGARGPSGGRGHGHPPRVRRRRALPAPGRRGPGAERGAHGAPAACGHPVERRPARGAHR